MNYGYECKNWDPEAIYELSNALSSYIRMLPHFPIKQPYVEINGLYQGVRIRAITHMDEDEQMKLIKFADEEYLRIARKYKYSENNNED